uniref:G-protein coupled receptors family 1 profile domain-containing protein n=1 Tax=Panagrolaimus superbus TaxID=310955 RepID=A0A914YJD8_9BILA
MSNSSNNGTAPMEHMTAAEVYFYLINGSLGTIFNAVVLVIALRHADTYDKPRQIAVINMTFADLITCLIYMITRPYLNLFPEPLCYPYYVTIFTSQMCSCLNLLWLNLDKLIYIKFPLHYYQMVSRVRVLLLTIASWTIIITLALTIYFFMTVHKMFKRLFFVFSSTIWTCITCLPYRLLYLTYLFCSHARKPGTDFNTILVSLITTFFPVVVIGIVINPWITILTQRMYRECLLVYLHNVFSIFNFCGLKICVFDNPKSRRQSRPSLATQRSSAASRNEFSECKGLKNVDV